MRVAAVVGMAMVLGGCSDYALIGKGDGPEAPPLTEPEVEPEPTPEPELPTEEAPAPTCADFVLPVLDWRASETFQGMTDPTGASGLPFWRPAADVSGWDVVSLPDRSVPTGDDRAYVTELELDTIPPNLSLNLQSDDGLWVWVNGEYLGNWGGAWQEEGCVNDNAQCLVTVQVPAVDITDLLVEGRNVIAARVSNPVANAYFEILPVCAD